jgi:hypothetical protein
LEDTQKHPDFPMILLKLEDELTKKKKNPKTLFVHFLLIQTDILKGDHIAEQLP